MTRSQASGLPKLLSEKYQETHAPGECSLGMKWRSACDGVRGVDSTSGSCADSSFDLISPALTGDRCVELDDSAAAARCAGTGES